MQVLNLLIFVIIETGISETGEDSWFYKHKPTI